MFLKSRYICCIDGCMCLVAQLFQVLITDGKNEFMNALTLKKDVVLVLVSVDASFQYQSGWKLDTGLLDSRYANDII